MKSIAIILLACFTTLSYSGDSIGGGGGGGIRLESIELNSFTGPGGGSGGPTNMITLEKFKEKINSLTNEDAQEVLSHVDNVTLEGDQKIKYIDLAHQVEEYLKDPRLESIQLSGGEVITR